MTPEQLAENLGDGVCLEIVSAISRAVSELALAHDKLLTAGNHDQPHKIVTAMLALCDVQVTVIKLANPPAPARVDLRKVAPMIFGS